MEDTQQLWNIKFFDESALLIINGQAVVVYSKSEGSQYLHEYLRSSNGASHKALTIWDALCESNLPWKPRKS